MKCPLFIIGGFISSEKHKWGVFECVKEECAWWHEGLGACAIYLIQEQLALVFGTLREIVDKMPSPGFFKK